MTFARILSSHVYRDRGPMAFVPGVLPRRADVSLWAFLVVAAVVIVTMAVTA